MDERGCGCGNGLAAIIIVMIAAVVGVSWYQYAQMRMEVERQMASERAQLRERAISMIVDDVEEADRRLREREPGIVLCVLRHADEKLYILATSEKVAGETEAATRITRLRIPLRDAIEAIEAAENEERQLQAARDQLQNIRAVFAQDIAPGEAGTATEMDAAR